MLPTPHCTWCATGRTRAPLIAAMRAAPRESSKSLAKRFSTSAAFVDKVRCLARARGCLSARQCEGCGGRARRNGGLCRRCRRKQKTRTGAAARRQQRFWWPFVVKRCLRCHKPIPVEAKLYSRRTTCEKCPRWRGGAVARKGPPALYLLPGPLGVPIGSMDTKAEKLQRQGSERPVALAQVLSRVGAPGFRSGCTRA